MLSTVVVIVLSSLSRLGGLSSLPMTQSCSLVCRRSTHTIGNLSHKTMLWEALTDTGHMWYTRAHVPICAEDAPRLS
nr:MAG TPA: hypothetical protein [Caudoviricetes sp.]